MSSAATPRYYVALTNQVEFWVFNNHRLAYKLNELILKNCAPFDCGGYDLNDFFAKVAIAYEGDLRGKTYCWLDNSNDRKIVAMITLANAGIRTTHMPGNPKRHINKTIAYNKQDAHILLF